MTASNSYVGNVEERSESVSSWQRCEKDNYPNELTQAALISLSKPPRGAVVVVKVVLRSGWSYIRPTTGSAPSSSSSPCSPDRYDVNKISGWAHHGSSYWKEQQLNRARRFPMKWCMHACTWKWKVGKAHFIFKHQQYILGAVHI